MMRGITRIVFGCFNYAMELAAECFRDCGSLRKARKATLQDRAKIPTVSRELA